MQLHCHLIFYSLCIVITINNCHSNFYYCNILKYKSYTKFLVELNQINLETYVHTHNIHTYIYRKGNTKGDPIQCYTPLVHQEDT